jgi:hypothetical protein
MISTFFFTLKEMFTGAHPQGLTSMETRPPSPSELQQCQGCRIAAVPRVETLF